MKKIQQNNKLPFVSICTPTFNRRPFIPMLIHCVLSQDYPKDKIEWIIIDDGTDKIEDLISHLPFVKYFKYSERMLLGKKRNLMHKKTKGDILVYMDDDDYYPPQRISHAVERLLTNPDALCAGSSEMYIYFKKMQELYKFGPYGEKHATAASFAFHRNLLTVTKYDDNECLGEEKTFLKNYTIPFVQLDPFKTILVFSHIHNSCNKEKLIEKPDSKISLKKNITIYDFIKNDKIAFQFFINDIDSLLENYLPGLPENKPEMFEKFEKVIKKRDDVMNYHSTIESHNKNKNNINSLNEKIIKQNKIILELMNEINILKSRKN
jgi:glycosyltransferase involved in cell wall biosynthesis